MESPMFFHPVLAMVVSLVGVIVLLMTFFDRPTEGQRRWIRTRKGQCYLTALVSGFGLVMLCGGQAIPAVTMAENANKEVERLGKSSFVSKSERGCLLAVQADIQNLQRCEAQAITCATIDAAVEQYRWEAWNQLEAKRIDQLRYFATCGVPIRIVSGEVYRGF